MRKGDLYFSGAEYSDKGSPYGEYYNGPNGEVISKKMFGLQGLINPAKEPDLDTNGGMMYYYYNGRHTVSELTDRHGDLIESYRYEAFGGIFEGITAPYNTSSYTGHQYDDVAGLMDMKARWYDPQTAGFLSEDMYPGTLTTPFTQNRYAYVGNNPINMWDPTGHVPEWVRAKNDYEIESYSKTVYRDANGDGVEDDFYYSEDYREWHQFNSYSSSWGTVNHIGRASYNTYYIDYFSQTFTETWNYTYREDWYWWVSFIGPLESHPSSPETFIESTEHLWSNTVTAQELSEGVEAAKLEYGSPPANALKRVTVSLNGTQLVQHSSFDGVTVSAQVLINEEQYSSSSSAEQRIIAKTLYSFLMPTYSGAPMDDISEEEEATLIAHASQKSNKLAAERAEEIKALDRLITEMDKYQTVLEQSIAMNKKLIDSYGELIQLEKSQLSLVNELNSNIEDTLQNLKSFINAMENKIETADQFLDQYSYLDGIHFEEQIQYESRTMDALDQVLYGNYTDTVTNEGTIAQVILSLIGIDVPADVRDTWYDVTNWEWTWGHAGQTGLDAIGFLPLVGVLKNVDEANAIRKGCNCFTAGTKVLTDEGEKNIEDIEVGDKVLSKNEETGEQAFKEVTHLYLNDKEIIYELTVGDQLIETTDNHPFWVEGEGWVLAADLHVGDKLQQSNGNTLTIDNMKIVKHDELVKVYNFTVADFHTYYVSSLGIWVHNISCAEINWEGFSSGKLKPHWEKHGHEFGDISQNEYLKLAKGFAAETNFSFKEQVVGNFLVKYDPSSGRVLVGHIKDRQIRTFYKDDGRSADPFQAAIDLAKSLGGS